MRDAFGGIVNISFIVVFMVIVNGYLAFAANYNKAFRYKNRIINIIEQNEGYEHNKAVADEKINQYRLQIGYSLDHGINVENYDCNQDLGFCIKKESVETTQSGLNRYSYDIITAVNIDIPILNKFLPDMKIFQVTGTTKTITEH